MGIFFQKEKAGHWIQHTHLLRQDVYECSECHCESDKAYKICPSRGVEMKVRSYDPSWVDEAIFLDIMDDEK